MVWLCVLQASRKLSKMFDVMEDENAFRKGKLNRQFFFENNTKAFRDANF